MKININNYEAYFIDYLEGNLDELLVNDFIAFLQNNPELKKELSLLESVSVEPENISFSKKDTLYKEKYDSEEEFNKAAIAGMEGNITATEKSEFENYIVKHPEKKRDVDLFNKTQLNPDETILFRKKKKLYRISVGKTIFIWSGRVAAILVLAFAFFTLFNHEKNDIIQLNEVAVVEDKTTKKVTYPEEKISLPEIKKVEPKKDKKELPEPTINEKKTQSKPNKSVRESTKGRLSHEDLAILRTPVEVPVELSGIIASLNIQQPKATLATMYIKHSEIPDNYYEERLLTDIVKEKTGLDKFQLNKITNAGLKLISNISNEKFNYKTNREGKVTKYNYESRLFAFSIPSKNSGSK